MNENIAWAAGLLEGEGSFMCVKTPRGQRAVVACAMTDLDVLERLKEILGGSVYSTKKRADHHKEAWCWRAGSQKEVQEIIEKVLPYLLSRRTLAAQQALKLSIENQERYHTSSDEVLRVRTTVKSFAGSGLTHREIADKVGIDRSYVSHILRGKYD